MADQTNLTLDDSVFKRFLTILDNIDKRLDAMTDSLTDVQKASKKVEFKFKGVENLNKLIEVISRAKVNQIESLANSLVTLSKVKFSGNLGNSINNLLKSLEGLADFNFKPLQTFASAFKGLANIPNVDTSVKAIERLAKAMSGLSGAGSVKVSTIGDIAKIFGEFEKIKLSTNVDETIRALTRFANGLTKINSGFENLKPGTSKKIALFSLNLQAMLGIVGIIGKRLPGSQFVKELSLTLERLGIGISGLLRNIDKISVGNTAKLAGFISFFTLLFNLLSRVAGNTAKLKVLGDVFTAVADLLGKAFTGIDIKKVSQSKDLSKIVRERIELIIGIVAALRRATGLLKSKKDDYLALAQVFQGLGTIFSSLTNIENSSISTKAIDSIINAVKRLSQLRVSKDIGNTLLGLGNILKSTAGSGISGAGFSFGKNLSDNIAAGFLKGSLQLKVLETLGRLFTDLNPAVLLGKFTANLIQGFVQLDKAATAAITNILNKVRQLGVNIQNIGTNLVNNFGVGALFNSQGFQIATEFEDLANRAKVFGDLTEEESGRVLELADAIGIKYPLSANEALKAIINLQKAGLGVQDLENAVAPIADLTALSESQNIDNISRIVIQTISSFTELSEGVASSFENAEVVANILSRAADSSTASVESLGQGLGNVGPIASQFGLTLEETAAILATFEDNGIRGAEAGTQLRSVLSNLTRPTEKVQGELNRLGISLTDDAGNFRSLNDIINDFNTSFTETQTVTRRVTNVSADQQARLEAATKAYATAQRQILLYNDGLTAGALSEETAQKKLASYQQIQANAAAVIAEISGSQAEAEFITSEITRTQAQNFETINTIFGTFGQQGAAILIAQGQDAIEGFVNEMNNLPTAAERAQQLMDTFKGSLEQLRGSGETLLKNFFLPIVETIAKPFTDFLVLFVNTLLALNPELLAVVSTAITFGAALATISGLLAIVVGGFIQFGVAIASVLVPFLTFTGAFTALISLTTAIVSFVAGLAAFVAVLGPLAIILGGIAIGFRRLIRIFGQNLGGATDSLNNLKTSIGDVINFFGGLVTAISAFANLIFGGGTTSLDTAGRFIGSILDQVSEKVAAFGRSISNISTFFQSVTSFINGSSLDPEFFNRLTQNPFISFLLNRRGLDQSATGIRTLFENIKGGVDKAKAAFQRIGNTFNSFVTLLQSGLDFRSSFAAVQDSFAQGIGDLGSVLLSGLGTLFNVDFANEISSLDAGNISEAIGSLLSRALEGVKTLILGNREGIKSILTTIFNFLFVPGKIFGTIAEFLGLDGLAQIFTDVQSIITGAFGGIVDTIFNLLAGQDLTTAIQNAFGPGVQPLLDFVSTLGSFVENVIGLITDLLSSLSPTDGSGLGSVDLLTVVNGVLEALSAGLTFLTDNVLSPLREVIRSINFEAIFSFLGNLFDQFVNFFRSIFSGDIGGSLGSLGNIAGSIIDLLKNILTNVFQIDLTDLGTVISSIAELFTGLLTAGLNSVANLLGFEDFSTLASSVITSITTAISDFLGANPAEKFAEIATTLITGLGTAITNAFSTIGDFLGLDSTEGLNSITEGISTAIENIKNILLGDDGSGIFGDIATIFDSVKTSIEGLFSVFGGGQNVEDIITFQDVVQGLFDFFGRLIGLGLETLTDPLTGIAEFFDKLADLEPEKVTLIVAALGALALALLPILAPAATTAMVAFFGGLIGFVTTIAGAGAAILAISNFVTNIDLLVDAISSLLELDIASAVGSLTEFVGLTASGITFDVLGLFGITDIFGQTEEDINATVTTIAEGVSSILTSVGESLSNFFTNVVLPIITTVSNIFNGVISVIRLIVNVGLGLVNIVGTLVFSPIILVFEAIEAFANLPEDRRNKILLFFGVIGATLAFMARSSIIAAIGNLGSFIITLGSSAGALAATTLTTIGTALGTIGTAILSFAGTLAGTILPIGTILVFLVAAVQNADKLFGIVFNIVSAIVSLFTLDFATFAESLGGIITNLIDFIGSVVLDAVFFIASFFGITEILGNTKEDFERTLSQIIFIIETLFLTLGNRLKLFFSDTIDDIKTKFNIAAADLQLALSDAAARLRGGDANDPFFKVATIFDDPANIDINKILEAMGDQSFSQSDLDLFARKFTGQIAEALNTRISDPTQFQLTPVEFSEVLSKLDLAGGLDAAVSDALASDNPAVREAFVSLLQQSLSLPPDQQILSQGQVDTIIGGILADVERGTLDGQDAINILQSLPLGGDGQLSEEQRIAAIAQIQTLIDSYKRLAEEGQLLADGESQVVIDLGGLFEVAPLSEEDLSGPLTEATKETLDAIAQRFVDEEGISLPFPISSIQVENNVTPEEYQEILKFLLDQIAAGATPETLVIPPGVISIDANPTVDTGTLNTEVGAQVQSGLAAGDDISATVNITPKVEVSDDSEKITTDVQTAIQAVEDSGLLNLEVPVAADFTNLDPIDVASLSENFGTLNTGIDTAQTNFDAFATNVAANILNLQNLATEVTTTSGVFATETTNIQTVWTTFDTFMQTSLQGMIDKLKEISTEILNISTTLIRVTPTITESLVILQTAFITHATPIANILDIIVGKLYDINFAAIQALTQIAAVIENVANIPAPGQSGGSGGSGGGSQQVPGRASGGPVWPGLFEIMEEKVPEVLFQDGRAFLLSPSRGMIQPLMSTGVPTFGGVPAPSNNRPPSVTNSSSTFEVNEGAITVNVTGGSPIANQAVAEQIRGVIREELANRNESIRERLRTAGRS